MECKNYNDDKLISEMNDARAAVALARTVRNQDGHKAVVHIEAPSDRYTTTTIEVEVRAPSFTLTKLVRDKGWLVQDGGVYTTTHNGHPTA